MLDIDVKELIVQVMKELEEQGVPMDTRKTILASLCYCVLQNVRYKGVNY